MDKGIRKAQEKVLKLFAGAKTSFALTGGTALELFYLHHRFSVDLDFFSPKYDIKEIKNLIALFEKGCSKKIKFENEFAVAGRARVRFYTLPVKGTKRPLKMDFVQDVLLPNPGIKTIKGVRVYSAESIYFQKLTAICGNKTAVDDIGREVMQGRNKARDAFDLYMLSKTIKPLHKFLPLQPRQIQRGMVHWFRTFSRQEMKLAILDLDIYDHNFDAKEMIGHLEEEIAKFVAKEIEE